MGEVGKTGQTGKAAARPAGGRHLRLLTWPEMMKRAGRYALLGAGFIFVSLSIGILGYRWIAGLAWIDALYNASLILSGMGPVDTMRSDGAKLFASFYALAGGAVYPAVMAIVVYPFLHHMLVALHIQAQNAEND